MKYIFIVLIFLGSVLKTIGQDEQPTIEEPPKQAISLNLLGTTTSIGIGYTRQLSKRISAEIGLGLVSSGLGVKYYFR